LPLAESAFPWPRAATRCWNRSPERSISVAVEKQMEQIKEAAVNNIIYIIGLIVVVIAILSFFGLR